jgi:uncharacterized 2Fe-2S/4Fe-4S cluster protein (DUF4445 family)
MVALPAYPLSQKNILSTKYFLNAESGLIYHIELESIGRHLSSDRGATILEVARSAGIPINSVCGGRKTCGRCKVRIISGRTSALSKDEKRLLNEREIENGYRLACAARVLDNIKIFIPPYALLKIPRLQLSGNEPDLVLDPVISVYNLQPEIISLNTNLADWENVKRSLVDLYGLANVHPDISVLRDLSSILRANPKRLSVLVRGNEAICIESEKRELLGVAFDIGTTTIAAYLVNLRTGMNVAARGSLNPQIAHGEDVMSRISYAMEGGGEELRTRVLEALNGLICELTGNPEKIVEVTIVGNTAMHHLVLGLPVRQLGLAPYLPAISGQMDIKAREFGLNVHPGAYVHFLPNIGGFVGADHLAMLLATRIYQTDKTVIGIDIGTNTEVTLAVRGVLTSLSCASGPAFEGGGISHGMMAINGAIEHVKIDEEGLHLKTIRNTKPIGICGSGILDIISELRRCQIIDLRGVFQEHPLVRQDAHGGEFVVVNKKTAGVEYDIVVTRRDIEKIQLAKAAVRTGISVLLSNANISENEIDEVIIAGAFGGHINVNSAVRIGLFPPLPLKRFKKAGNAAGSGAKLVLISKKERSTAAEIAQRVHYLELSKHPGFLAGFSHSLLFP